MGGSSSILTDPWVILGLVGQTCFGARFVLQWLASEREKRSVIPVSFWYLSLVGALILLVYSVHRQDPVFIVGQSMGFIIYIRNLQFILKPQPAIETAALEPPDDVSVP